MQSIVDNEKDLIKLSIACFHSSGEISVIYFDVNTTKSMQTGQLMTGFPLFSGISSIANIILPLFLFSYWFCYQVKRSFILFCARTSKTECSAVLCRRPSLLAVTSVTVFPLFNRPPVC